jgi:hypothetical protein
MPQSLKLVAKYGRHGVRFDFKLLNLATPQTVEKFFPTSNVFNFWQLTADVKETKQHQEFSEKLKLFTFVKIKFSLLCKKNLQNQISPKFKKFLLLYTIRHF